MTERCRLDAMLLTNKRTFFKGWVIIDEDEKMPVLVEIDRLTHPYIDNVGQIGPVAVLVPVQYGPSQAR